MELETRLIPPHSRHKGCPRRHQDKGKAESCGRIKRRPEPSDHKAADGIPNAVDYSQAAQVCSPQVLRQQLCR